MHALIELAIRRPVGVSVAVALVALFGLLAVTGIPIQLTPDIALPRISVRTVWPGASPEEVEKELLEVQEEALRGVPGVARFESNARPSRASISMEFRVGQDMTEALLAVSNRLSQVPRYPENVREPLIEAADATGPPLAVLIIKSDDEENRPVSRWRKWASLPWWSSRASAPSSTAGSGRWCSAGWPCPRWSASTWCRRSTC